MRKKQRSSTDVMHTSNTPPKKILIFSLAYFPFVGGAEVSIDEITKRVSSEHVSFSLICAQYNGALPRYERIGAVEVYRVGWGKKNPTPKDLIRFPWYFLSKVLYPLLSILKAIQLSRREKFDLWWVVLSYAGFGVALYRLLGLGKPYILTLQEGDTMEVMMGRARIRPFVWLLKQVFVQATLIHSISRYLGDWAKRMGYEGEVVYIPNGISVSRFVTSSSKEKLERVYTHIMGNKIDKKDAKIFLITTSRLVEKNGIDTVIRALPLLASHIHFIILGEGPEEDALKALAKELEVEHRAHFLGNISQEELPAYYQLADIFVRPSRSEGQGISFIEAFGAGLPVIATQVGGIADFLFDRKRNPDTLPTGFAVSPNSPEEIKEQVEYILSHPEEVREVVVRAKELAHTRYNWDTIAKEMEKEVFCKVLEK